MISLTSLLLFRTPLACDASLADSTRSRAPTAPLSAPLLLLPGGRRGPDRGQVARAAVEQYKTALAQGIDRDRAVHLLA